MPDLEEPTELTFEKALGELEAIVTALEAGQLDLEDSLVRYERGVGLLRNLQRRLADAELRVTMLVGELEEDEAGDESE